MINPDLLVAFVGFAFVSSITPGPNNLMVMASGAGFGWRRTLPHVAGIAGGFAFMLGVMVLGLGAMLVQVPQLVTAVRLLGGAWLLWLAWRLAAAALQAPAQADGEDSGAAPGRPLRIYEAALFQWVNPKAWALATASAGAYVGLAADPLARALAMMAVFLALTPLCNGAWILAGEALRRLTGAGRSARVFGLAMAALLAASAVPILIG